MDIDLTSQEERLTQLCNHLENSNRVVNYEIESLFDLSKTILVSGTFETNGRNINLLYENCIQLLEIEINLVKMIYSTLLMLNVEKNLL